MPIIAKGSGDFTPAPEGLWPAVCIDIVDKGMVESKQYKPRHMIQIRFLLDAEPKLPDGRPHVAVRSFGLTLVEKSALRPFLEAWRGKKFTEEELRGFDVEKLIGVNGQVQILHNSVNGKMYANIQAVVPYPRGLSKMQVPADYIRQEERDRRAELEAHPDETEPEQQAHDVEELVEEPLPF